MFFKILHLKLVRWSGFGRPYRTNNLAIPSSSVSLESRASSLLDLQEHTREENQARVTAGWGLERWHKVSCSDGVRLKEFAVSVCTTCTTTATTVPSSNLVLSHIPGGVAWANMNGSHQQLEQGG